MNKTTNTTKIIYKKIDYKLSFDSGNVIATVSIGLN